MKAFDIRLNFAPDQLDLPLDLQLDLPVLDAPDAPHVAVLHPLTLAEQVSIEQQNNTGESSHRSWPWATEESEPPTKHRSWPWLVGIVLLAAGLLMQSAYFFRTDLAAQLPDLKPALSGYCQILNCRVPLPQHTDLIGIESSELQADPGHDDQITLNALVRNRAAYAQGFPNLELTLTDSQDKPVARRMFIPADYLPETESEALGLSPNRELSVKLHLNIGDLKPSGYRLVLLYQNSY